MSPEDRVLLLSIDGDPPIGDWAGQCYSLVCLGRRDQVRAARHRFAENENLMFAEGDRGAIPWAEGMFTLIIDPVGGDPTPEMLRVLNPAGRIVSSPLAG